jgi:hypothetical protein
VIKARLAEIRPSLSNLGSPKPAPRSLFEEVCRTAAERHQRLDVLGQIDGEVVHDLNFLQHLFWRS